MKYEIYKYDVWGNEEDGYTVNDVIPTGIVVNSDVSKHQLCKLLGLSEAYDFDVDDVCSDVIPLNYAGEPCCEVRLID